MPVTILLAQTGQPAGSPGQARSDFVTGTPVQASAIGGPYASYQWSFVSKAIDITAGVRASSAFGSSTSSTTSVDPIDVAGEYLIQVAVDSGQGLGASSDDVARIVFYAGTVGSGINGPLNADPAELPQQLPAFREQTEDNTADVVDPAGNTEGWSRKWLRLWAIVKRIYLGKSWAWGQVTQSGASATIVGHNATVARTGLGTAHVTFTRTLPNSTYAVVFSPADVAGSVCSLNRATTGFDVERADIGGSLADLNWSFDVRLKP